MCLKPPRHEDPLYLLLRDGNIKEFNSRNAAGERCELTHYNFCNLDLRKIDASGMDLSNSYFRSADLRGTDLSKACLDGASINGAKISGTLFSAELRSDEITLSVVHGTRMRYKE